MAVAEVHPDCWMNVGHEWYSWRTNVQMHNKSQTKNKQWNKIEKAFLQISKSETKLAHPNVDSTESCPE